MGEKIDWDDVIFNVFSKFITSWSICSKLNVVVVAVVVNPCELWVVNCRAEICVCASAPLVYAMSMSPHTHLHYTYQLSANWFMLGMNKWQLSYCIQELHKLWSCALCINLKLYAYFILNATLCMELAFFMIYSNV